MGLDTVFQVGGTVRTCEQGSWGPSSEGRHVCQATVFAPGPGAGGLALESGGDLMDLLAAVWEAKG